MTSFHKFSDWHITFRKFEKYKVTLKFQVKFFANIILIDIIIDITSNMYRRILNNKLYYFIFITICTRTKSEDLSYDDFSYFIVTRKILSVEACNFKQSLFFSYVDIFIGINVKILLRFIAKQLVFFNFFLEINILYSLIFSNGINSLINN